MNDKFCILPWVHLTTWPNGKVFQCCNTPYDMSFGNLNEDTIPNLRNSEYMNNLRLSMINGESHSSCNGCYKTEKSSVNSPRIVANEKFSHLYEKSLAGTTSDGKIKDVPMVYWDFRFSNLCNFKCRMCGEELSSKWHEDTIALNKIRHGDSYTDDNKSGIIEISEGSKAHLMGIIKDNIYAVEEVYFAGGEPLIIDEHYEILSTLISSGRSDIKLVYNTNISKLTHRDWKLVDMWEKFDSVVVGCSIDAIGNVGEFIRSGSKWDKIKQNLKTLTGMGNVNVLVTPAIQILNIFEIPQLIDELQSYGIPLKNILLTNILHAPSWYNINMLPVKCKEEVMTTLTNHLSTLDANTHVVLRHQYEKIISFMNQPVDELQSSIAMNQFREHTNTLNSIRNIGAACLHQNIKDLL